MKTYCFVTNLSLEDEPTVANRLLPYITESLKKDNKVILVSSDKNCIQRFDNNLFTHILSPYPKNKPSSFLRRAIFEWIESRKVLKIVAKLDADVVVITIPSMFLLFNVSIVKKMVLYLDVRDLTWEYLSNQGGQFLAKLLFRIKFNMSYKLFNSIVVTNEAELEYFKLRKIEAKLYYNGVNLEQFIELSTLPEKHNDKFVISYIGNIGIAQNIEVFILAAEALGNLEFNIVGSGPEYQKIESLILSKGLKNVNLHGKVDWDKVLHFYQESDLLYAQLSENFSGAVPSKLYQYLSTGKFVIYGGNGQACKFLSKFSNNITIRPNNVEKLISAIKTARDLSNKPIAPNKNVELIQNKFIREVNVRKVLQEWDISSKVDRVL